MNSARTIREKLQIIYCVCDLTNILFFSKMWIIQTFFEVAITIITLEGFILYTDFFSEILQKTELVQMILLPIAFAAIVSIIYVIFAVCAFINHIYNIVIIINSINDDSKKLRYVVKKMKTFFKIFHCIAFILYPTVTLMLIKYLPTNINLHFGLETIMLITIISVIAGITWAFACYFANVRTDWRKIFKNIEISYSNYEKEKYREFMCQLFLDLWSLLFFICCFLFIIFNFREEMLNVDDFTYGMYTLSFFAFVFCTLFILGAKNLYSIYYIEGKEKIYPNLQVLLKDVSEIDGN